MTAHFVPSKLQAFNISSLLKHVTFGHLPASMSLFPWHAYVALELFPLVHDQPVVSQFPIPAAFLLPLLLFLLHQLPIEIKKSSLQSIMIQSDYLA
jgi:hypothetical protein